MRLIGKIKSVPIGEPKVGMWGIMSDMIWKIVRLDEDDMIIVSPPNPDVTDRVHKKYFNELVIEYQEFSHYSQDLMKIAVYKTKQIPLNYSDWKEVIESGLVNSTKVVDFDFQVIYFDEPNHPTKRTLSGSMIIGKFKPKKYTEYELLKHMMEFGEHVALEITGKKIQCVGELLKYWTEYETNRTS